MSFVEAIGFVSDVLFVFFSALILVGILVYFAYYVRGDLKKEKEEAEKEEQRCKELDDEIDFIAARLGYKKNTKDEDNEK